MAQRVQVLLTDDLDGGEATETVSFALDAVTYEIDLSEDNARKLRKDFASYTEHARKAGSNGTPRGGRRNRSSRVRTADIRNWARGKGYQVSERGRIPVAMVTEYDETHP